VGAPWKFREKWGRIAGFTPSCSAGGFAEGGEAAEVQNVDGGSWRVEVEV